MSDPGRTYYLPYCDECPRLWDWPVKFLIAGQCPRCSKPHPRSWRMAAARRVIFNRERDRG